MENSNNEVENLLIIYSADEGKLKVLLKKREKEPYKSYWVLPGEFLDKATTLEESSKQIFNELAKLNYSYSFQGDTFSDLDRYSDRRVIALTTVIITDKQLLDIKKEKDNIEWFDVDNLPKLGFDHKEIVEVVSQDVKKRIASNYNGILLSLFPSDFTLSELQSFYENITEKEIDRRNFKKKITTENLIVDTGLKDVAGNGRPGTLYRFNNKTIKDMRL